MTGAKVELLRKLNDALWRDRDLGAALELVDPDADLDWSDSRAPYGGRFKGHDGLRHFFQMFIDAWDEWYPEFEEVIDVGPETILIVTRVRARGKGSGVPVEARGASIWSVRDGKVVSAKLFQPKAEALAALGVSEPR